MKFPFEDDPGELLRQLFRHDRLQTTARNLGDSSITKGEGALELRLTDDGPAQAAYGDLPGGGFGLGILSGGQLISIQSWVNAQISAANQALSDRLDSHASRIGAAETAISGLQSRMTTAEGRLDSHVSRIGALENRADAAENQITGMKAKNTEQDVRLNNHESRIRSLENGGGVIPP